MEIIRSIDELKNKLCNGKKLGKSIGLVPTMGYLHNGHKSLIDRARKENDIVVVSVFVNPTQFGPGEDLEKYPRDEKRDSALCENAGVDYIFMPQPGEMYPQGFNTYTEVLGLSEGLCGRTRPIHFKGVCTVVLKLFNIVTPDRAYFGQKDAQQFVIIKRMVKDLNLSVTIVGCPIVRENDGLALSSRNTYLSKEEREQALILNKSLTLAENLIKNGERDSSVIINKIKELINTSSLAVIDYVEVVDMDYLKPVKTLKDEILIALAVKFGKTRLIDNRMVTL